MYKIRKFEEKDIDFVQVHDNLLYLSIRYNRDYDIENAITVTDEEKVVGVAIGAYHNSWYSEHAKVHKLVAEFCPAEEAVMPILIKGLIELSADLQSRYPDKVVQLVTFLETTDIAEAQLLLKNGFCYGEIIPVLAYDLTKETAHYSVPEAIRIEQVTRDKDEIQRYIDATGQANDQVPDSLAEYRFRKGDPSFVSFKAVCGDEIVGGITIWNINDKRGATENIFVIPDFRRKNIARELIATAFDELKERGMKIATLSMSGGNAPAMKLYQSVGYELMYYITELVVSN